MKRFKIEEPNIEITTQSGLALLGQTIKKQTHTMSRVDHSVAKRHQQFRWKKDIEAINEIDRCCLVNRNKSGLFPRRFGTMILLLTF